MTKDSFNKKKTKSDMYAFMRELLEQELANNTDLAESLRDWFKKEKWVRITTSGDIAGPCGTSKNTKNDKGNVVVVNFGDAKGGLTAKINNKEARKAFSDRLNCPAKKDKTKAGYWSCRLPRYASLLGLKSSFGGYW